VRSLRFRLPTIVLVAVLVAAVITAAVAARLFQDFTRDRTVGELRRQAEGLAQLYRAQADPGGDAPQAPRFAAKTLERATGARLYFTGTPLFVGQISGLRELGGTAVDWDVLNQGRKSEFEFVPADDNEDGRTFLAVAQPLRFGGETFAALVVAKPNAQLAARFLGLLKRAAIAVPFGIVVAALLGWWLSRRVTTPLRALGRAADEVARRNYDVAVPALPPGDEIGHLSERFGEMAAQLAEAEELSRNFLMSVSHELRTPLTAIRGHVDALREGLVEDEDAREQSLEVIAHEAERLSRLVGDVLDLAKLDAHRFALLEEEVDLSRLLEQAQLSFAEEARRREIVLEADVAEAPTVVTDGDRVLQVVSNLLSNALHWTPDGGRVRLVCRPQPDRVRVVVEDSGPGMQAEVRDRVFRPFFSLNGPGGTGLGLAIAHELAGALGGRLTVTSEPGRGSRFELLLPLSATQRPESIRTRLTARV
jgi:signal transduction histidine kinase